MFISKVVLVQSPEILKLFKGTKNFDGYAVHQLLWNLFPNEGDKKRDFIFSKSEREKPLVFLVVSKAAPVETDGILVETKQYDPILETGQQLMFSLTANPVIARKNENRKYSRKHDVWMDAKKQAIRNGRTGASIAEACEKASKGWLIRQGLRHGFSVEENNIIVDGYLQNRIYKAKTKHLIQYSSIHYEGILTVLDVESFKKMLFTGIGRSKAFGCGLMLVRPL